MKRSVVETVLGAVVLLVAAVFLAFSYKAGNAKKMGGYEIVAAFSGVGGLEVGDDVLISGVKVGNVSAIDLDPKTYLAQVHMSVDPSIKLPTDTAALISSKSLLGGLYLALEPGADEDMLKPGARIQYTQAPQNLEQLLGQFIFSMQKGDKGSQTAQAATPAAANATAPTTSAATTVAAPATTAVKPAAAPADHP